MNKFCAQKSDFLYSNKFMWQIPTYSMQKPLYSKTRGNQMKQLPTKTPWIVLDNVATAAPKTVSTHTDAYRQPNTKLLEHTEIIARFYLRNKQKIHCEYCTLFGQEYLFISKIIDKQYGIPHKALANASQTIEKIIICWPIG